MTKHNSESEISFYHYTPFLTPSGHLVTLKLRILYDPDYPVSTILELLVIKPLSTIGCGSPAVHTDQANRCWMFIDPLDVPTTIQQPELVAGYNPNILAN